jgi:hypothetical protein
MKRSFFLAACFLSIQFVWASSSFNSATITKLQTVQPNFNFLQNHLDRGNPDTIIVPDISLSAIKVAAYLSIGWIL